jgi:DNA-binding PadR family transcriptional regulator
VSPVFRHGRLRLYLLKLLDEAPRHGYEVIRLLQDRFLGVYAPSPGTIYPRLARLEEEGLVTHDEVDGKKIYRITEKGRDEIDSRLDDLADLEEELTESVRDIAREVTQDVRDTVRSLREELTLAARDMRSEGRARAGRPGGRDSAGQDERPGAAWHEATGHGAAGHGAAGHGGGEAEETKPGEDEAARLRDEASRAREQMRAAFRGQRGQGRRDWGGWQDWHDWAASWQEGRGWPGSRPAGRAGGSGPWPGGGPRSRPGGAGWDSGLLRDLERMAIDFASELRAAGGRAGGVGENAATQLRGILEDALTRIRNEVFRSPAETPADAPDEPADTGTGEPPGDDRPGK